MPARAPDETGAWLLRNQRPRSVRRAGARHMLRQFHAFLSYWLFGVLDSEGGRRRLTLAKAWEMAAVISRPPRKES